jgi:hypothetical protein
MLAVILECFRENFSAATWVPATTISPRMVGGLAREFTREFAREFMHNDCGGNTSRRIAAAFFPNTGSACGQARSEACRFFCREQDCGD